MDQDLLQRLQNWFPEKSKSIPPLEAAAALLACKEDKSLLQLDNKQGIFDIISKLTETLFRMDLYNRTGSLYSAKTLAKASNSLSNLSSQDRQSMLSVAFQQPTSLNDRQSIIAEEFVSKIANLDKKDINSFTRRAKNLAKRSAYNLANIDDALLNVLQYNEYPDEIIQLFEFGRTSLIGDLNRSLHTASIDRLESISKPEDGPKSHYEMLACCLPYLKRPDLMIPQGSHRGRMAFIPFNKFVHSIYDQLDDLPSEILERKINDGLATMQELFQTHEVSFDRVLGLMRFYTSHNQSKFQDNSTHANLELLINQTFEMFVLGQIETHPLAKNMDRETQDQFLSENIAWSSNFITSYSTPTTESVAGDIEDQIRQKYTGKKQSKLLDEFNKVRNAKPEQMDEVVVLYYQENEEFRKLRQSIFKNPKRVNGDDGPKRAFLKSVAHQEEELLAKIGLEQESIQEMQQFGRIPSDKDGKQLPLSIEHIYDRDYGGTNHDANFILMPKSINEMKNSLKRIQQKAFDGHDQGFWMLSWIPKQDQSGYKPRVLDMPI